jgi:hypothetical protein
VPERLLLGTDALTVANSYEQIREAEKQQWLEVTNSTTYHDAAADTLDPTSRL